MKTAPVELMSPYAAFVSSKTEVRGMGLELETQLLRRAIAAEESARKTAIDVSAWSQRARRAESRVAVLMAIAAVLACSVVLAVGILTVVMAS